MWTISKVFIEFVTILILFYVLVLCSQGLWDLGPRPGVKTIPLALEAEVLTTDSPGKTLRNHFNSPTSSQGNIWKSAFLDVYTPVSAVEKSLIFFFLRFFFFFLVLFLMWTTCKVFTEFVTILLLFSILAF